MPSNLSLQQTRDIAKANAVAESFKIKADQILKKKERNSKLSFYLERKTGKGPLKSGYFFGYFNSYGLRCSQDFSFTSTGFNHIHLCYYCYASRAEAALKLREAATIEHARNIGLTYSPNFIYRIDNKLYWLSIPNYYVPDYNKTFGIYFRDCLKKMEGALTDSMEGLVKYLRYPAFDPMIAGSWKVNSFMRLYYENAYTARKAEDSIREISEGLNSSFSFDSNSFIVNGSKYCPEHINAVYYPSGKIFFEKFGEMPREITYEAKQMQGGIYLYRFLNTRRCGNTEGVEHPEVKQQGPDFQFVLFDDGRLAFWTHWHLFFLKRSN